MTPWHTSLVSAAMSLALACGTVGAQPAANYSPSVGQAGKDVVWVPTSQTLVDRMLDMAKLTPADNLVDLGSGDGRLVITAAKRGATARGIEFNGDMVGVSKRAAAAEGVAGRASFEQADIFKSEFSNATVVTLFLLPDLNLRLRPTLLDMKPGTRVVSNSFTMDDWQPDETAQVVEGCASYCNAYKWTVPAQVDGTWKLGDKQLVLRQKFQMLEGQLRDGPSSTQLSNARLDGAQITFSVGSQRYAGEVAGNAMRGTVNGQGAWSASR